MAVHDEIYTVVDFVPNNLLQSNKLNETNLIKLYKAYFEDECSILYNAYSNCPSDETEITLPSILRQLYRKFERNIKLIQEKPDIFSTWETDKKKLCFYLKYWIYDELIKRKITDADFSKFINFWNERKEGKCRECNCEFQITSFSHVKHLKKAYDYFLFLDAYKDATTISKHIADKYYCRYIDNAKTVYSLLGPICERNHIAYCKEFRDIKLPPVAENDYSSISCKRNSTYDHDLEEGYREAQVILEELATRKKNEQEFNARLAREKEDYSLVLGPREGDIPRAQSQHDPVLFPRWEDRSAGLILPDNFPVNDALMLNPYLNIGSEGNGSPMKTTASALLFSPVRSWLDSRIQKTKRKLKNSVRGSNELQSHDYNSDTTNMDFNRLNIGYQTK